MPARGSGGFSVPRTVKAAAGDPPGQLYDLAHDPAETRNVWAEHPDIVARLQAQLDSVQRGSRTRR